MPIFMKRIRCWFEGRKMPEFVDLVFYGSLGLVLTFVVVMVFGREIGPIEYGRLDTLADKCPIARPEIASALENDWISRFEMYFLIDTDCDSGEDKVRPQILALKEKVSN